MHTLPPRALLASTPKVNASWLRDGYIICALLLGPVVAGLLASAGGQDVAVHWPQGRGYDLVWLALFYPLLEEWLFRGVLQTRLRAWRTACRQWLGVSLANVAVSLLFVACHALTQPWSWALAVGAPSLLFGWFRDRHGSILPGVILHCFYNFSYFMLNGLPAAGV